jgi:hypothetical protein
MHIILKSLQKNLKKIIPILSTLLHQCIKFQVKIPMNEGAVKKIKKFDRSRWINLSEISLFELEILYIDGV